MTKPALVLTVAALAVSLLAPGLVAAAGAASIASKRKRGPARLLVLAKEFSYVLSRQKVRSGRVIVQLANAGEDAHNLRLRRIGAKRSRLVSRTAPGKRSELDRRLKPGRYYLWCSIADHEARGMHARLVVKRRKAR